MPRTPPRCVSANETPCARSSTPSHGHAAITAATAAIVELLGASGPLFHRTIEVQLGAAGTPVMVTRLALKLAWERGVLSYLNQAAGWNREVRVFTLTASTYPTLDTALDPHTAVELLMAAYLDRYGPISIKDATWWSALSRTAVTEALQRSGVKLVRLFTPWSHSPLYMSAQRFAEYTVAADADYLSGVNLLAHEDVALKAYFETRRRYLGDLAQQAAFNQIGEVLPTIVLDGRVVGTWRWDPSAGRVRHRLIPGLLPAARRPEVRAAAARHTAVLCSGLYHAPRPPDRTRSAVKNRGFRRATTGAAASVALSSVTCGNTMHPLPNTHSPSLEELQRYVAEMEQERGFTHSSIVDQCLKLAEETGEVCKAVRKQTAMSIDPTSQVGSVGQELADVFDLCRGHRQSRGDRPR
ncbi:DNA glycosylase AlkZ-like family protein [Nonomuraea ferruginea]